jgi:hypothetical protein
MTGRINWTSAHASQSGSSNEGASSGRLVGKELSQVCESKNAEGSSKTDPIPLAALTDSRHLCDLVRQAHCLVCHVPKLMLIP